MEFIYFPLYLLSLIHQLLMIADQIFFQQPVIFTAGLFQKINVLNKSKVFLIQLQLRILF